LTEYAALCRSLRLDDVEYISILSFHSRHDRATYLRSYLSTIFDVADVDIMRNTYVYSSFEQKRRQMERFCTDREKFGL